MKPKKDTRNKKQPLIGENSDWLFKELGVYDDDPEKDRKINNGLIKFLKSKGIDLPKIKFKTTY